MTSRAARLRSRGRPDRPGPADAGPGATDAAPGLGRVQQLVLRGDGLTTTSLEILTGERIDVAVDGHWRIVVPEDAADVLPSSTLHFDDEGPDVDAVLKTGVSELGAGPGDTLLVREILLVGTRGRVHGSAEVVARYEALPEPVVTALATTSQPIGRLLRDNGVQVVRELGRWGFLPAGSRADRLGAGLTPTSRILGRTYLMRDGRTREPIATLTERFCPHLFETDQVPV
jgi:chorismate-pyruvate lyase